MLLVGRGPVLVTVLLLVLSYGGQAGRGQSVAQQRRQEEAEEQYLVADRTIISPECIPHDGIKLGADPGSTSLDPANYNITAISATTQGVGTLVAVDRPEKISGPKFNLLELDVRPSSGVQSRQAVITNLNEWDVNTRGTGPVFGLMVAPSGFPPTPTIFLNVGASISVLRQLDVTARTFTLSNTLLGKWDVPETQTETDFILPNEVRFAGRVHLIPGCKEKGSTHTVAYVIDVEANCLRVVRDTTYMVRTIFGDCGKKVSQQNPPLWSSGQTGSPLSPRGQLHAGVEIHNAYRVILSESFTPTSSSTVEHRLLVLEMARESDGLFTNIASVTEIRTGTIKMSKIGEFSKRFDPFNYGGLVIMQGYNTSYSNNKSSSNAVDGDSTNGDRCVVDVGVFDAVQSPMLFAGRLPSPSSLMCRGINASWVTFLNNASIAIFPHYSERSTERGITVYSSSCMNALETGKIFGAGGTTSPTGAEVTTDLSTAMTTAIPPLVTSSGGSEPNQEDQGDSNTKSADQGKKKSNSDGFFDSRTNVIVVVVAITVVVLVSTGAGCYLVVRQHRKLRRRQEKTTAPRGRDSQLSFSGSQQERLQLERYYQATAANGGRTLSNSTPSQNYLHPQSNSGFSTLDGGGLNDEFEMQVHHASTNQLLQPARAASGTHLGNNLYQQGQPPVFYHPSPTAFVDAQPQALQSLRFDAVALMKHSPQNFLALGTGSVPNQNNLSNHASAISTVEDSASVRVKSVEELKSSFSSSIKSREEERNAALVALSATLGQRLMETTLFGSDGVGVNSSLKESRRMISHPVSCASVLHAIENGLWTKNKLLGRGSFGSVYSVRLQTTGQEVAVKELFLSDKDSTKEVQHVDEEMRMLRDLVHPHLLQYYSAIYDRSESRLLLFTELCEGGSLGSLVRTMRDPLPHEAAARFTAQILSGLHALHQRGIVHRDIKSDNILLTNNGVAKIADFGTTRFVNSKFGGSSSSSTGGGFATTVGLSSLAGTPAFIAPEVLGEDPGTMTDELPAPGEGAAIAGSAPPDSSNSKELKIQAGYGRKADIWSLGILLCEVFNRGNTPWPSFNTPIGLILHIAECQRAPIPSVVKDKDARDFIAQCCKRRPQDRPTAAELLQHPFIVGAQQAEEARNRLLEPSDGTLPPTMDLRDEV